MFRMQRSKWLKVGGVLVLVLWAWGCDDDKSGGTKKESTETRAAETKKTGAAETKKTGAAETKKTGAAETKKTGAAETKKTVSTETKKTGAAETKKTVSTETKKTGATDSTEGLKKLIGGEAGAQKPLVGLLEGVAEDRGAGAQKPLLGLLEGGVGGEAGEAVDGGEADGGEAGARAQRTYVWARTDSHNGDLDWNVLDGSISSRNNIERFCTTKANSDNGKPEAINDDRYVTKTLVLSHTINTFEALGAQAVKEKDGASAEALTYPVHGLSGDGRTKVKLADNYKTFRTTAWASTLKAANVGDTKTNDKQYWIGLDATEEDEGRKKKVNRKRKNQDNYHCQDFSLSANGMDENDLEKQGSFITETTELLEADGSTGCNEQLYFLCISFSKN